MDDLVGTERSHGDRINKLLTYEAENCRPFYMQTLPDSEGTPWNKNDKWQRINNKCWSSNVDISKFWSESFEQKNHNIHKNMFVCFKITNLMGQFFTGFYRINNCFSHSPNLVVDLVLVDCFTSNLLLQKHWYLSGLLHLKIPQLPVKTGSSVTLTWLLANIFAITVLPLN